MAERFHGWDLALNHSAFIELGPSGSMAWMNFVIDTPGVLKKVPAPHALRGTLLAISEPNPPDKQLRQLRRLVWWRGHIKALLAARRPGYVAAEDYAIHATGNSAYNIGELGGVTRAAVLTQEPTAAKFRLHDPMSVKMYVAHQGNADPEVVAHAVEERWPETKLWHDWPTIVRLDLAVAYGVAQMCLAEWNLRTGVRKLSDFHEKEVQVFNRVTQTYPQSLLSRDWSTL